MSLKKNLNVLEKKKTKMQNFFCSNKKGKYKLHGKQFVENIC